MSGYALVVFSKKSRSLVIEAGELIGWDKVNPDILGSMLQAVASEDKRSHLGMHYTSVPNIMKVINPLFLDDLHEAANGSENTAWQYDTDYEFLNDESIKQIIIAGARFLDGYVRLEIAGIDNNKIVHQRDELSAIDKIKLDMI